MTEERRLYRSRNGVIAGICAGFAERCDSDPIAIRILCCVLTLATCGLAGIAYLIMWRTVPLAPRTVKPVEVDPKQVRSDTFGLVDCDRARGCAPRTAAAAAREAMGRYSVSFGSAAHVPPEPPPAASGHLPPQSVPEPSSVAPAPAPGPAPVRAGGPPALSDRAIVAALLLGGLLLVSGIASLIDTCVDGVAWWQCWPLLLVVFGIVRMAIPAHEGLRTATFVGGLSVVCAGVVLMAASVGIVSWMTLPAMADGLWPLLLASVLLGMAGVWLRLPVAVLVAGLLFVAFCIVGLALFAMPGPLVDLSFAAPYGRVYHIPLPR